MCLDTVWHSDLVKKLFPKRLYSQLCFLILSDFFNRQISVTVNGYNSDSQVIKTGDPQVRLHTMTFIQR